MFFLLLQLLRNVLEELISPVPRLNISSTASVFVGPFIFSNSRHPGISSLYGLLETQHEIIRIEKYFKNSILSLSRLATSMACASLTRSSGDGAKDMRLRFVLYQLFRVVAYVHSKGYCIDLQKPQDITLSDDVWVTMNKKFSSRMMLAAKCVDQVQKTQGGDNKNAENEDLQSNCYDANISLDSISMDILLGKINSISRPPSYYEPITLKWVTGKISNFDYLMAINSAAGRNQLDPSYHPVLPWVTDFRAQFTSGMGLQARLRDLTKTKFRLSKGDQQLSTTYEHSNPPHHIPEILSELTYYIYMARRTPMHTLKKVVRGYFVADHYPHSMRRMYNWTPDECCPEFFMDASVFQSKHKDHGLEDIELPPFADSPEAFLLYHRSVLESDEVSSQLHHWIDLNFGFQLTGEDAIKNLNVPLQHSLSKQQEYGAIPELHGHPGFAVLFHHPHPKKEVVVISNSVEETSQDSKTIKFTHSADELAMIEMAETYGIVSTPYPDMPHDTPQSSPKIQQKYLSNGNRDDKTLLYLNFAKSGRPPSHDNGWHRAEALKFSSIYGTLLEPCYEAPLVPVASANDSSTGSQGPFHDNDFISQISEICNRDFWNQNDIDFAKELDKLTNSSGETVSISPQTVIRLLQAQDLFALGCIIIEVFCGGPILGVREAMALAKPSDMQAILRQCFNKCKISIPLNLRRIATLLTHPCPAFRPTVADILKQCCAVESDFDMIFIPEKSNGCIDVSYPPSFSRPSAKVCHLLEDYCYFTFPSLFQAAYLFIGRMKLARDGISKLKSISNNLHELCAFTLEGVSLLLPHVLEVISDPAPFQECLNNLETAKSNDGDLELQNLVSDYSKIVNVLSERLGSHNTSNIVLPRVLELLKSLNSTTLLLHFIKSKFFWLVLLSRGGSKCFLRYFLPLLLTYIVCGSLKTLRRFSKLTAYGSSTGFTPLWVNEDRSEIDVSWWLHESPLSELQLVQEEATRTVVMMSLPDALGMGLCVRYVLPALLSLAANPRYSISGFGFYLDDDDYNTDSSSKKFLFCDKAVALSEYPESCMYVTKAILGICNLGGEVVISNLVLPKLLHEILPGLLEGISNAYSSTNLNDLPSCSPAGYVGALLETIAMLRGMINMLSLQTIRHFYFNAPMKKCTEDSHLHLDSAASLFSILKKLPLPYLPCPLPSDMEDSTLQTNLRKNAILEFRRLHAAFLELNRLVVVAASQVGPEVIQSYILPAIDKFFTKFVHTYCDLDVRSDVMSLAFEIGRSLYLPLVQLVGADTFSTAVPEVNPRLEVWLLHDSASSRSADALYLPDTIYPVEMSKQDTIADPEPQKKEKSHWLPDWMLSSSSTSKQKSSSQSQSTSVKQRKEAELRLNQQMDDAMRGAIAQQEDQRNLIKTPVKRRDVDSDDDSEDAHDSLLSSTETDERFGILEGKWSSNYVRNPRTKSIMHYAGENSFYRNLHTSIVCVDEPKPDEKVYFKHVKSKQSIPLVTRSGNLAKNPSVTFQGSVSKGDDNVVESFKKVFKASIQRSTSKGDSSPLGHENSLDDMDGVALAQWNSDRSWIFGGSGRWSVLSPERINPESHSSPSSKSRSAFASPVSPSIPNFSSALSSSLKSKAPAAVSMANPEVVTDAATEASEPFAFQMINQSSWAFDELAYQAGASGAVSLLLPDATERFLVAGTKDGEMKVWSLSSNPLVELMKYSSHQTSIISAGFLKSGTHVASCDGSIRIWDIERGMTIADLQKSHSEMNAFCHLEVVSPRFGVGSDMSKHGDDQLATCAGTVLAHYDTRVGYASTLNPISEWKIVSTLAGGKNADSISSPFMSMLISCLGNDSSYPIALTCSASNEKYVCVASANGTLWAYDRRTGVWGG